MTRQHKPKQSSWWLLPFAVAVVPITANAYLLIRATGDPSFAVEESYYQKAVDWDAHMEELRRSAALGWQLDMRSANGAVLVHLTDRAGAPVDGATVKLEAFAVARSRTPYRATLTEEGEGWYAWQRPPSPSGRWELRLRATRGDDLFVHTAKRDLP